MFFEKFKNFMLGAFLVIGVLFLIVPKNLMPDFYYPSFMAFTAFLSAFLVFLPKLLFRSQNPEKCLSVIRLQAVIAFSLLLNGLGGLGLFQLYKVGFEFDKLVHFVVPFLFTVESVRFLINYFEFSFKEAFIGAVIVLVFGSFAGEAIEFIFDVIFKSATFGLSGTRITEDTKMDLIMDFAGIFSGTLVLLYMNKKNKFTP